MNDGKPVWHSSVSAWSNGHQVRVPQIVEREAVKLLRGVGGDREWWAYSPANVGHLRIGVTDTEDGHMTAGCAVYDAGDTGPERPRTR